MKIYTKMTMKTRERVKRRAWITFIAVGMADVVEVEVVVDVVAVA